MRLSSSYLLRIYHISGTGLNTFIISFFISPGNTSEKLSNTMAFLAIKLKSYVLKSYNIVKVLLQQDNSHLIKRRGILFMQPNKSDCIEHIFSESNKIENKGIEMHNNALIMTDLSHVIVCYFMCPLHLNEP